MDVQILKVAFQLKHPAIFGLNSARNVIAPNKIKTIATNEGGGRTKYTKSRPFDNNCANYNNSDTQIDVTTNNATQESLSPNSQILTMEMRIVSHGSIHIVCS